MERGIFRNIKDLAHIQSSNKGVLIFFMGAGVTSLGTFVNLADSKESLRILDVETSQYSTSQCPLPPPPEKVKAAQSVIDSYIVKAGQIGRSGNWDDFNFLEARSLIQEAYRIQGSVKLVDECLATKSQEYNTQQISRKNEEINRFFQGSAILFFSGIATSWLAYFGYEVSRNWRTHRDGLI